ncbi:hypothetical protein, unknown function [Leishmania tarentolae]|uniref:Uncharacterized protein n=1 Tax=Leishmania tarentolae TaxID=5689 RepID=A0A640KQ65_LEITA|nr:hypothetical protein, unknown function [Leishmania tarentolae]
MGNAAVCSLVNKVEPRCHTRRQSNQPASLATSPRSQMMSPHPPESPKSALGTSPRHPFGRQYRTPQQENCRISFIGSPPVDWSNVSLSHSPPSDPGRSSPTPPLELSAASLIPSVGHCNLEGLHDYSVDMDVFLSKVLSGRIAAEAHADESSESSNSSSYFTPSLNELEMLPDPSFAAPLQHFTSSNTREPLSDPPTPLQAPLPAMSRDESPCRGEVAFLSAGQPVAAVSATHPVTPGFDSSSTQHTSTRTKTATGTLSSSVRMSSSSRRGAAKTKTPFHRSGATATRSPRQRRPSKQVTPLQATHEMKPTHEATPSRNHESFHDPPQGTLPRQSLTHKYDASPPTLLPLTNAAASTARTGGSSIAGSNRPQGPAPPAHLVNYREYMLTRRDVKRAEAANNRRGFQSSSPMRNALSARKNGEMNEAASLPNGAPTLLLSPTNNVRRSQVCTGRNLAESPGMKGGDASSATMNRTPTPATKNYTQSTTNGCLPNNPASSHVSASLRSGEEDAVQEEMFIARGAAASFSPTNARGRMPTEVTTAKQHHAPVPLVSGVQGERPSSASRGAMNSGSLTFTDGNAIWSVPSGTRVPMSVQGANGQNPLHAAQPRQEAFFSATLPPDPSPPQDIRQRRRSYADARSQNRSDDTRPSGKGECLPHTSNELYSIPVTGAPTRVNSILKKNSSYRSLTGSPVERTLPSARSVSFLLCEQEASLAMVSRQDMFKAVMHHEKPRPKEKR